MTQRTLSENESWLRMAGMVGHCQLCRYGTYPKEEKKEYHVGNYWFMVSKGLARSKN